MTWLEYHKQSEQLAGEAEAADYKGEAGRARELYRQAAELEEMALKALDRQKIKTLGITAVSAAALWYKAGQFQQARKVADDWLASNALPAFAVIQLDELLKNLPQEKKTITNGFQVSIFWDAESEAFIAEAPALPGCAADGSTRLEAVASLEIAIEEWIETAKELNRPIPRPEDQPALA